MHRQLHSRFSPWSIVNEKFLQVRACWKMKPNSTGSTYKDICLACTVQVGPSGTVTCLPVISLKSCDLLLDFFGLCMQPELCKLYTVVWVFEGISFILTQCTIFLPLKTVMFSFSIGPYLLRVVHLPFKKRDGSNKIEKWKLPFAHTWMSDLWVWSDMFFFCFVFFVML